MCVCVQPTHSQESFAHTGLYYHFCAESVHVFIFRPHRPVIYIQHVHLSALHLHLRWGIPWAPQAQHVQNIQHLSQLSVSFHLPVSVRKLEVNLSLSWNLLSPWKAFKTYVNSVSQLPLPPILCLFYLSLHQSSPGITRSPPTWLLLPVLPLSTILHTTASLVFLKANELIAHLC